MEVVRGELFRGGVQVAAGFAVRLGTLQGPGAQQEWHGGFRLPLGSRLEPGEYALRLTDGRAARIRVTFASVSCDKILFAQFVGTAAVTEGSAG